MRSKLNTSEQQNVTHILMINQTVQFLPIRMPILIFWKSAQNAAKWKIVFF